MITEVTDKVRTLVFGALSSDVGNQVKPIRVARELLSTANDLVGRPFCEQAELERRRQVVQGPVVTQKREAAPVIMYFDGKDHRTKKKMEELLAGRDIKFRVLDVTDDEATRAWCLSASKLTEFPLVFVAGESIGSLHELTQADVNGDLKKRVFGA